MTGMNSENNLPAAPPTRQQPRSENRSEHAARAHSWLSEMLTGWGIPGEIARIIAGAIIGGIAAYLTLHAAGCSASFTRTAGGDVHLQGSIAHPSK